MRKLGALESSLERISVEKTANGDLQPNGDQPDIPQCQTLLDLLVTVMIWRFVEFFGVAASLLHHPTLPTFLLPQALRSIT